MEDRYKKNTYYLVRHGEAGNNVINVLDATKRSAYGLTERGCRQIRAIAERLAQDKPDFVVASPVRRAKESALIIQERLAIPLFFDERLWESHFGVFDGETQQSFLDFMMAQPGGRVIGDPDRGVEGYMDIRERIRSWLMDFNTVFTDQKVVIVSHGDPLQEIYAELLGEPVGSEQGERGWYPEKGSLCILRPGEQPEGVLLQVE